MSIEITWISLLDDLPPDERGSYVLYQQAIVGFEEVGSLQAFRSSPDVIYAWANGERIGPVMGSEKRSALTNARAAVEARVRAAREAAP
ncbi:hypothetical protein ACTZWW_04275 [Salinarimonas sp. NSM]|uniref:hypothetical protein n=1 Tax=Salinarimonas sp. NSM TaxID=3458003 RepID=UPI004036B6D1